MLMWLSVQDLQLEDPQQDADAANDDAAEPAAAHGTAADADNATAAAASAAAAKPPAAAGNGGSRREGARAAGAASVSVLRRSSGCGTAAAEAKAATRTVVLQVGGKPLTRNLTVLQAAMQAALSSQTSPTDSFNAGSLWGETHTLQYSLASELAAQNSPTEPQNDSETPDATTPAAAAADAPATTATAASAPHQSGSTPRTTVAAYGRTSVPQCSRDMHLVSAVLGAAAAPVSGGFLDMPDCVFDCLVLLRMIERITTIPSHTESLLSTPVVPPPASNLYDEPANILEGTFHSTRTNARLLSQLGDIVAICSQTLPPWVSNLPHEFKCLLPFSTRRRYLLLTSFDVPRTLTIMNGLMREDGALGEGGGAAGAGGAGGGGSNGAAPGLSEIRVARIPRQKVRVSRQRVLDSAIKVFGMSMSVKSVLEFEFFNEVGTGLGPTLEFYTLLATELRQRSLGLWQDHHRAADDDDAKPPAAVPAGAAAGAAAAAAAPPVGRRSASGAAAAATDSVHSPAGLFPRPYPPGKCPKKVIATFDMMGRAVAKCIQDGRMMDLDLSLPFLSLILSKPLDFAHLEALDPVTANSLLKIKATAKGAKSRRGASKLDGCNVDDLCLYFTLPGYPDYELCPGGKDKLVCRT